jgi:glycosyltransferase involved in cell wall biosynthesis
MSDAPAPAVSIIIATYNRAPVLRLALESVRRQRFSDWEALVIGDGCTDGSAEIVADMGDARFHWHNLPSNSGSQAVPNNVGLELARGRWVAYLGHDDLWFPWHLQELVEVIAEEGADFAHALVAMYGETGLWACWGGLASGMTYAEHNIAPTVWLHRRELAAEVGGWADPRTLDMPVDFHLSRRMALAGATFAYQPYLSALKFPSPTFTTAYRNEHHLLQATFLRKMRLDAEGLEWEVLQEIANLMAGMSHERWKPYTAEFLAGGGSPESVTRYQARRNRERVVRGLDENAPPHAGKPPMIHRLEPAMVTVGEPFNVQDRGASVLSVHCSGVTPETFVLLDNTPLSSWAMSPELVCAIVPEDLTAVPGAKWLVLLNRAGSSRPAELLVHRRRARTPSPGDDAGGCAGLGSSSTHIPAATKHRD